MGRRCSISMAALLVTCLISELTGCGSSLSTSSGDSREARGVLKVLGIEYARFVDEHGGRPPADKQELSVFFKTRQDRIPGLQDVGQLFVSPRDSEPLVIFYGKTMPPADESGFPTIAREATGAGGICLVVNARGGVQEMAVDQVPSHLAHSQ
jgi:hypothetical protein